MKIRNQRGYTAAIIIRYFWLVLIVGLSGLSGCDTNLENKFDVILTGKITSAIDGAPIPGVAVLFMASSSQRRDTDTSDNNGNFAVEWNFENQPFAECPDSMQLTFEHPEYIPYHLFDWNRITVPYTTPQIRCEEGSQTYNVELIPLP